MTSRPLCFVLMPFGQKNTSSGGVVNFDAVYRDLIVPSLEAARLEPIRADEELTSGSINKSLLERLVLSDYVLADLTTSSPNVFFELGVRQTLRPQNTVAIFCEVERIPFDLALWRALPYRVTSAGTPADVSITQAALVKRFREAPEFQDTNPIYEILGKQVPEIDLDKVQSFRSQVEYWEEIKGRLVSARHRGIEAVRAVERDLGAIPEIDSSIVIDLFLSYRAVKGWEEMIALAGKMAPQFASSVVVQQQLALALNRIGKSEEAEGVIMELLARTGPNSESYGILGRIYKDRWETAEKLKEKSLASALLDKAIDAYVHGFETDWRDAYPGINAVTLMEMREPPDPRREKLLPVVRYAVERRIAVGKPDYWDFATRLELALLAQDQIDAQSALESARLTARSKWEIETTARNLRLINEARERRGVIQPWMRSVELDLAT
jgi:MAP3K TRAFs-binding domain